MSPGRERIGELLARDGFPFRVAMFDGTDPELGVVLEVQAFDVPEARVVAVSRQLNHLVRQVATEATTLACVFDELESLAQESDLPKMVTWYRPQVAEARPRPAPEAPPPAPVAREEVAAAIPRRFRLRATVPVAAPESLVLTVRNSAGATLAQVTAHPAADGASWNLEHAFPPGRYDVAARSDSGLGFFGTFEVADDPGATATIEVQLRPR